MKAAFLREIDILRSIRHRNLVRMYKVYETKDTVNLVFEHLQGGDLRKKVSRSRLTTEENCLRVLTQIMQGLSFLHSNNIVHRDLKPANIFLMYLLYKNSYIEKTLESSKLK